MRIIDTHLHLVYPDRFAYPWLTDVPALNRPFSFPDYWEQAEKAGIAAALHIEVDVVEEDREAETRFVTGLDPRIAGAVASCRPENADFAAELERLAAIPGVKGLRRILHTSPDELSQTPLFAENLNRIAAHELTFDLCVLARQLPVGRDLAARCPDVQFILDHCGVPDIEGDDFDTWADDLRHMSELPNVAVKISGISAYARPDWSLDDLRPWVEHTIACFGWDRVVWGSDYPVCTLNADLGLWVETTRALLAGTSGAEQEQLFSRNAERLYRLRADR
ncbi:Predicted metal-dependent hydrolase, TIM-barrel fold [Faunimonas pinastri]|uniref:Predicted metal-dependent hydrolase, TIM-barrel fold n=1 Tax=Faunimonas pinastri TaxID=1855383 RepID=A0A1H9PFB7_9HYPH|nr:amidohydrolase [Faunimonas pinastri]SER46882.1 Predicted metal-dependent hydrolase, TIM-barrel fold [Faunimonas pinastri]